MSDADFPRPQPEEIPDGDGEIDLDTLFDLLSNRRRRELLRCIPGAEVATVDDLAREVGERIAGDRTGTRIALYHLHLPKLEHAGLIEYDPRSETVRYEGNAFVDDVLARTADEDRSRR